LTHTITLVADHLGVTAPKVLGHEYYVDAIINVTDFNDSQAGLTANFTSADNGMVITAGTVDVSLYKVGQNLILAGTVESFSGITISAIDSENDTLTLSSVTADNAGDSGITISTDQEVIAYSDFGLSKVTQVSILGQENDTLLWNVELGTDGATKIADHLVLKCNTASSGAQGADDVGTIRVRLFGQL